MERLEERVVLSTWLGTDAATNNNWSDPNNWDSAPTTGSDLTFQPGLTGAALTSNDDISGGSFGSLKIQDTGYSITASQGITAALSGSIDASQSGTSTLDVPVDFGTNAGSITVDQSGAMLVMGGTISGSNGLTTQGSGTLDLTGASAASLTGTTTVAAGTLLVDGSLGDVAVSSGATLGGTGTVSSVASTAGTVSPGDSPSSTGILTDSGDFSLDGSSNFDVAINGTTAGTNYDQLDAGGAINLNGATLNVSLGSSFAPAPGQTFTILHNTSSNPINGTFNGLADGSTLTVSGYQFKINYVEGSTNDVVLTALATTDTWTGNDSTDTTPGAWSDANNWSDGVPLAQYALVFPGSLSGAALNSNNDLGNLTFSSMSIQGDGYAISGNGIGLAGPLDASGLAASTVSLPITFGPGAGTVTVDNAGASLTLSGVVSATSGLTKQGAGSLTLGGADGSMAAAVDDGTLLVDGSVGAVTVGVASGPAATLGGTGTVASIATTAATVSPGVSSSSTGILTDSGPLTLDGSSNFDVTLGGTAAGSGYDQLDAGGAINLAGATLNVALGSSFTPTPGQQFTILQNTGTSAITGTFAGLANGSMLTAGGSDFVINYQGGSDGQDVVLTAVTPPVVTWSGADASASTPNDNWSDPNNWLGGSAPVDGDTIVFPSGLSGAALTSNDDIQGGSFGAILIQGSGYTIASSQGYGVTLTGVDPIDASYGSGSSAFNLPVDLGGGSATLTVDSQAAGLKMGGVVSDSTGVTKAGAGVLDLQGTSTYTGPTTVSAGALLVDGSVATSSGVSVLQGATLGGTGTVPSIATTSATVSPGDSSSLTGILTDAGALTLDPGSSFDVTLGGTTAGTNYDQVVAAGPINLDGATLNISTGSFSPVPGQTFTIISNTGSNSPITGTFAQGTSIVADGFTFSISYSGGTDKQDVVLTAVSPQTDTWTGIAAAGTSGDTSWSNSGNWLDGVPTAGETLIFPASPGSGAGSQTSNNDLSGLTFNSLEIQSGGYVISGDAIVLAGTIDSSQSGSGSTTSSTVSLPISFNPGAGSITVDNAGASLLLTGAVSSSGLTKLGQGTLNLGANDGSVPAVVDAGTLLVDGAAGNITANTGATIGGTGSVAAITTVGATVSPGDSSSSTGILTDNGNLVLDSKSTFSVTLDGTTAGTSYDQVVDSGPSGSTINLADATLNVTLGSSFPTGGGQQYTILSNPNGLPITGTFDGLAQGGILTVSNAQFSISYTGGTDGHDVVLTSLLTTTTTVSPVTIQPVSGQSVTLTATVAPGTGTGTPTGSVSFLASINGTSVNLGTANLVDGVATLPTTKLTTGTDEITATYSGDTTYGTSTSPSVAVVVGQATTTTTLTASPTTAVVGQLVTLTATIAAVAPGSGTPTGSVTFYNGSTSLGSANLAAGVAVLNTTALPVGTGSITAVYSGDTNFTTSTSQPVVVAISQGTVGVTISASNTNPFALQAITLTAIVSMSSGGTTPTGTVTFETSNGTDLGTATLTDGEATLTTSNFLIGPQTITAMYSGDSTFLGASSAPLSVVIGHPNDLYINQVFLNTLGYPASYNATYWIALLNSGFSRKTVTRQILKSRAAKMAAVENVYETLLHRPATPKELHQAARSGNTSTTPLYAQVFGSKEFYRTQGGATADGWLTALATDWFGAPFPASVQSGLARRLAGGTPRTTIAKQVITSPSGVHAEVNSIFESVLGQPATAADQKYYGRLIRQGNMVGVYETLFTSNAFLTKYVNIV